MHELGGHQANGVAERGERPGPAVGAGTGFHANQTWRQTGNAFEEFGAWHFGAHQFGSACLAHAMHGEDVLCQINSNSYDGSDDSFQAS